MGLIEGHPRTPGLNARARRGSARLSTTDPDLVQLQGTFIVNVYTDLAGVGTHGEIAFVQASWESISRITLQRYLVYGSGRSGKLDE